MFDGLPAHEVSIIGLEAGQTTGLEVAPDRLAAFRVFVAVPADSLKSDLTDINVVIRDEDNDRVARSSSIFRGPEK